MSEDISTRNTVSSKIPEINSLYAYETRHTSKFTHRKQEGAGYRYSNHKAVLRAKEGEIHVYHEGVTIRNVTKGITMVTMDRNPKRVESWFDEQVQTIGENDKLFNMFNSATVTPLELGILYLY